MKKSVFLSSLLISCFMLFSIGASATAPVDTTNPVSVTVCSGATAKFFVGVVDTTTGATAINYKWQVSTDGSTWSYVTDVPPYSNSTTDTLSVTVSMALNGYWYRSIDSNNDGMDTSLAAQLTVDTLYAGTISAPPATCVGSSITLLDAVTGGIWSHINHIADTLNPSTGAMTGLASGFDTVTYVVTNICGIATSTKPIRVDVPATASPITGPTTTCVGHTIDLINANVLGTHTWSVSNATASITSDGHLTGAAHGFDTVTYVFTNGCNTVSSSVVVEIDTPLSAGTISGPTGVCAGSWIHLSETVGGGIWISSSPVAIVDGSGNVTGVSSGTVSISYLLSNGCGSSVATHVVTVYALAASISGGDSVGIDSTLVLSNSSPGGTWTIDTAGGIATIIDSSGVVTGHVAGSTTVTYTVTNLCGTSSSTMTLYVGPLPSAGSIIGSDTVCVGLTTTLSDTLAPGGSWTTSSDTLATIDAGGVVHGIAVGFVIVTYTVHNAFGSSSATYVEFIGQRPIITIVARSITTLGVNNLIKGYPFGGTYSATDGSLGTFVGSSDSGGVYSIGFYIATNIGTNIIHYRVHTPCGDADSTFGITVLPKVKVNSTNSDASVLNVYPNPNTGAFIMNLTTENNEPASVVITNIVGEKVKEFTISTNNTTNIKLDQPAGIYFLSANTATGRYTAKLIVTN